MAVTFVNVYKNGLSKNVSSLDVSYWESQGWSTSPTPTSSSTPTSTPTTTTTKTSTPTSGSSPTFVYVYKDGLSKNVSSLDVNYWTSKGWSTTKPSTSTSSPTSTSSQNTTTTTPVTANTNQPPAGSTLITSPAELSKYTESQIWRDPNSDKIYLKSGEQPTQQAPVTSPTPATAQTTQTATQDQTTTQTTGLNTSGLLEAWSRKQAGTANATDLANLDYAMSKGWTPPTGTQTSATQTSSTNGNTSGLNTNGLDEAYARKIAGTANATDLANLDYAMSQGWKPNSDLTQTVTEADKANEIINAQQSNDINAKTTSDVVETRSTVEDIMAQIKSAITPSTPAPETPNYEQALTDLNKQYGVSDLQNTLNDLQDQQRTLLAEYQSLYGKEHGKTVALNVIEGRISEEERQANERLTNIGNAIASVSDQLNTANSTISAIMQTKQMDYETASAAYKAQMDENISLFNAAQGIEQSLKTDAQNAIDNARSSAQILVNGYSTAGLSFSDLSPSQQAQLTELAVKSGFDPSFYETLMSVTSEVQKDILTQIISDDKSQVSIVYKDGTTATIPTGFSAGVNVPAGGSGGGSSTSSQDKEIAKFRNDAADLILKLDQGDIAWGTAWDQLHVLYPEASPQLIDQALGGGYDPTNPNANDQGYYGRANK